MRVRNLSGVLSVQKNRWFYVPKPNPNARLRLFCFHYAGGIAEMYHKWGEEIDQDIELCSIQLPGHSTRGAESPFRDMNALIEELGVIMQPYINKPFAFLGHSMGAMILFDYVQYLIKYNQPLPNHLFIAARKAPNKPSFHPHLHMLSDDEMIEFVRGLDVRPDVIMNDIGLLKKSIPTVKADFEMVEKWEYDVNTITTQIPITVFGAYDDEYVTKEELELWREFTYASFMAHYFEGDHFFILDDNNRKQLIKLITQTLL